MESAPGREWFAILSDSKFSATFGLSGLDLTNFLLKKLRWTLIAKLIMAQSLPLTGV